MGLQRGAWRWKRHVSSLGVLAYSFKSTGTCCPCWSESAYESSMGLFNTSTATWRGDGCAVG